MMESEPWERFWVSGKIEDYLLYAGMAEKPDKSAVGVKASSDTALSGEMGFKMPGWNNDISDMPKKQKEY